MNKRIFLYTVVSLIIATIMRRKVSKISMHTPDHKCNIIEWSLDGISKLRHDSNFGWMIAKQTKCNGMEGTLWTSVF